MARFRSAAERKADPNYIPPDLPKESAEDLRAHYYGYPNAAAYEAAKAAAAAQSVDGASVERAPTPANLAKSNEDEGSRKPTRTVEERRFSAASAAKQEGL